MRKEIRAGGQNDHLFTSFREVRKMWRTTLKAGRSDGRFTIVPEQPFLAIYFAGTFPVRVESCRMNRFIRLLPARSRDRPEFGVTFRFTRFH
jgi:hypothetical protein